MKSLLRIFLVVVVGAVILAACQGPKQNALENDTPIKGGVLREGLVQLGSQDPAKAQTVSERQMADQLYDGLTAWSPDGLSAIPALASSWDSTSDQKHWTFHLRTNAKASNGELITATDVKLSLEHIARKSSGSVSTDLLSDVSGFSNFTNNDQTASLLGVVAVDPTTVKIDLDQPFADLPLLLGNPTFGIVHYGTGTATYTTGPFIVSSSPDPTHVVLTKSPGSLANLNTIDVTYFPDVDSSYQAFQNNQVDWTPVSPAKSAEAAKTYGDQLYRTSLRTLYLSFNVGNQALGNPQFRQAIIQAIDRNAVANDIDPTAKLINGIVPMGIPGQAGSGCGAPCAYNVDHAKALLAQAFPNGGIPSITITAPSGAPLTDAAAQRITSDLSAVGITAVVKRLPTDQFNNFTVNPDRQVFQTSWSAAYPSAGAFLQPLFQNGSPSNVSGLNDAKTNTDLNTALTARDQNTRLNDYANVETDVLSQAPVIPLMTFPVDSVEHSAVRGIEPLPTGNFNAALTWIAAP